MNIEELLIWCAANGISHYKKFYTDYTFYRQNPHSGFWQWINVIRENKNSPFVFPVHQFGVILKNPGDLIEIEEFNSKEGTGSPTLE